jgi:aspartate kinase
LAHITDASKVTIWKDVQGMQNADPRWFNNTVRLPLISYREAVELSYYGASVIHPKTIQPLQDKGIELHVRSFLSPDEPGTVIQANADRDHLIPSYIFKADQILVSISRRDMAFVGELHLSDIFASLDDIGLNMNLMQLSALNFSFVMDRDERRLTRLRELLQDHYEMRYNEGVTLLTVRHYDQPTLASLVQGNEVLLEQKTRSTLRLVMRPESSAAAQ